MKTVVKIDPDREYNSAKQAITAIGMQAGLRSEVESLDSSVDNLKTVINVLLERATPKKRVRPKKSRKKNPKKKHPEFKKLPSEKFPDLEVKENIIEAAQIPNCKCCDKKMTNSGMFKTAEKLEVVPKQYYIVRHKRVIYCCKSCHGSLYNAPAEPSISPSSSYGDSVITDVALSKYCDLLPIERYSAMAARDGLEGLPANSLVGLTSSEENLFSNGVESSGVALEDCECYIFPLTLLEKIPCLYWRIFEQYTKNRAEKQIGKYLESA